MQWYWVHFHATNDGYYITDSWQLVAAESGTQIVEYYNDPNVNFVSRVLDVIPLELAPVPKTPRRTKNPRIFNPERKRP